MKILGWEKNHGKFIHEWLFKEVLKNVPSFDDFAKIHPDIETVQDVDFTNDDTEIKYIDKDGKEQSVTVAQYVILHNENDKAFRELHIKALNNDQIAVDEVGYEGEVRSFTFDMNTALSTRVDKDTIQFDTKKNVLTINAGYFLAQLKASIDGKTITLGTDNKIKVADDYLTSRIDGTTIKAGTDGKISATPPAVDPSTIIDNSFIKLDANKKITTSPDYPNRVCDGKSISATNDTHKLMIVDQYLIDFLKAHVDGTTVFVSADGKLTTTKPAS